MLELRDIDRPEIADDEVLVPAHVPTMTSVVGRERPGAGVTGGADGAGRLLLWRGHRAGPVVALAPALWAMYMYAQLIVGQEYLRLPGNNEQFFPLLLAVFVVGEVITVAAWRAVDTAQLPALPRRLERTAGVVLLVLAGFLVAGLHLPSLRDALAVQPMAVEYTSSPTAFWIVKLMDLGIIVPSRGRDRGRVAARHSVGAQSELRDPRRLHAARRGGRGHGRRHVCQRRPRRVVRQCAVFCGFTVAIGSRPCACTGRCSPHRGPLSRIRDRRPGSTARTSSDGRWSDDPDARQRPIVRPTAGPRRRW